MGILQLHYPERARVIVVANAPSVFSFIFSMIQPMLNDVTRRKVRITSSTSKVFEALCEFFDPNDIPEEYGGKLRFNDKPDNCRYFAPEEVALREHIENLNQKHGVAYRKRTK